MLQHDRDGRVALEGKRPREELEEDDPFEEGDLGLLADLGLPEAVLGVILADDEYADEQLSRIAQEMGFNDELVAVLDKLGR